MCCGSMMSLSLLLLCCWYCWSCQTWQCLQQLLHTQGFTEGWGVQSSLLCSSLSFLLVLGLLLSSLLSLWYCVLCCDGFVLVPS